MMIGSRVEIKSSLQGGNPKAAPLETIVEWIMSAWAKLDSELIIKSFKVCGLTNKLDGSEDDEIIVFKENKCCNGMIPLMRSKVDEGVVSEQDFQTEHEVEPSEVLEHDDGMENQDDDDGYYIVMQDHDYF